MRRWLAALRRLIDLQAGSIWRDLAGELAAIDGLVIDVGCGAQPYRPLLGPSARYMGIDTTDAKSDFGYEISDTVYFEGDSWPVGSESVNVVLCTETLEHVLEPRSCSPRRTVRSFVGEDLLTVPFAARWHFVPNDYWRFTPSSLRYLLETAGFTDVAVYARGNAFTVACYKTIALVLPYLFPQHRGARPRRATARGARSPVCRRPCTCRSGVPARQGRRGLSRLHRHGHPGVTLVFEDRLCPLCGSTANSRLFAEARFDPSRLDAMSFSSRKTPEGMHHRLLECTSCDLLYASPVPTFDSIVDAYRDAGYSSGEEARYAAATYATLVARIETELPDMRGRSTSGRVTVPSSSACKRPGSSGPSGSSRRTRPLLPLHPKSGR